MTKLSKAMLEDELKDQCFWSPMDILDGMQETMDLCYDGVVRIAGSHTASVDWGIWNPVFAESMRVDRALTSTLKE